MKNLILFLFFSISVQSTAFSGITVSNRQFCVFSSSVLHTVEIKSISSNATISVVGGSINSATRIKSCNGIAPGFVFNGPGSDVIITNAISYPCLDYSFEIQVFWDQNTCNKQVLVQTTSTSSFYVDMPNTNHLGVTGPNGYLCKSYTSGFYAPSNSCGYNAVNWTSTSSNGISLVISNPNSITGTTISNFKPNAMYSITGTFTCNGGNSVTRSLTVVTGNQCLRIIENDGNGLMDPEFANKEIMSENQRMNFGDIEIFPNPLIRGELLNFTTNDSIRVYKISVYSNSGELLKTINNPKSNEIGYLNKGNPEVYHIIFETNKGLILKKLILNKQ